MIGSVINAVLDLKAVSKEHPRLDRIAEQQRYLHSAY